MKNREPVDETLPVWFNAKKISAELDAALRKFFPAIGKFLTETRKYDKTIRSLKADNAELQEELKGATEQSVQKLLEEAKLRADYENLLRRMEQIPPEVLFLYSQQNRNPNRSRDLDR